MTTKMKAERRGRKKLPTGEHKKPVIIWVKEKNISKATADAARIENKYN